MSEVIKSKTRTELMEEMKELTIEGILLDEIHIENDTRSLAKLDKQRKAINDKREALNRANKRDKKQQSFHDNYMQFFNANYARIEAGLGTRKSANESQKVSLEILEEMIVENKKTPVNTNFKITKYESPKKKAK